jgi:ABC-type dipeptide/oligopeptide/nickel transport system permease subunit
VKRPSRLRSALRFLRGNREAVIGIAIVTLFVGVAIVVGVANLLHVIITPYGPLKLNTGPASQAPSWGHPFGTDQFGRDVFSRIIVATPNDVSIGLVVVGVALAVGMVIGSVAAFKGGLLDELLMRFTDVIFALPVLVIAMVIAVALGSGVTNMMIALLVIWWPSYARLARGEALKVYHQNYIEAARLSGRGTGRIIVRHVMPNIFVTMLVYATLDVGTVILVYAGLSYLGLSVRPPNPDWGEMVSFYQGYLLSTPWLPIIPGLVISLGVVGFSLLGDGIRDALEAR